MIPYEDVNLQLVDLPPINDQYTVPWIVNALQPSDAALIVVDVGAPDCLDQLGGMLSALAARRITLVPEWERADAGAAVEDTDAIEDPFAIRLPAALVASRADETPNAEEELEILQELLELRYPSMAASGRTGTVSTRSRSGSSKRWKCPDLHQGARPATRLRSAVHRAARRHRA